LGKKGKKTRTGYRIRRDNGVYFAIAPQRSAIAPGTTGFNALIL
jgi:hypothetical protein